MLEPSSDGRTHNSQQGCARVPVRCGGPEWWPGTMELENGHMRALSYKIDSKRIAPANTSAHSVRSL